MPMPAPTAPRADADVVDVHTHILRRSCPDWKERYGYGGFVGLEHTGPCRARMVKDDGQPFREMEDNCWDAGRAAAPTATATGVDGAGALHRAGDVQLLGEARGRRSTSRGFLNDHLAGVVAAHPAPLRRASARSRCRRRRWRSASWSAACGTLGLAGRPDRHATSTTGTSSDPTLFPVFEAAPELGAAVFVHPWDMMGEDADAEVLAAVAGGDAGGGLARHLLADLRRRARAAAPRCASASPTAAARSPARSAASQHGFEARPDLVAVRQPGATARLPGALLGGLAGARSGHAPAHRRSWSARTGWRWAPTTPSRSGSRARGAHPLGAGAGGGAGTAARRQRAPLAGPAMLSVEEGERSPRTTTRAMRSGRCAIVPHSRRTGRRAAGVPGREFARAPAAHGAGAGGGGARRLGRRGVEAHVRGRVALVPYHRFLTAPTARLVGAQPDEVVVMNTLTVNLHLMMVLVLPAHGGAPPHPRTRSSAFPSDRYASRARCASTDSTRREALVPLAPRPGEDLLRPEDVLEPSDARGAARAGAARQRELLHRPGLRRRRPSPAPGMRRGRWSGFDLAHGAGNLVLHLHDDGPDFASGARTSTSTAGPERSAVLRPRAAPRGPGTSALRGLVGARRGQPLRDGAAVRGRCPAPRGGSSRIRPSSRWRRSGPRWSSSTRWG